MLMYHRTGADGLASSGELGFSISGILDSIGSAIDSAAGAVGSVANMACSAASSIGPGGANLLAQVNKDAGYITGQAVNYCQAYNQATGKATTTTPPASAVIAPKPAYPAGSVARLNTSRNVYVIYAPATSGMMAMSTKKVSPAAPTGMIPVATSPILPTGVPQVGTEKDVGFFSLSNPWFWAAAAGTVVVVGGGGYMLFHKKHV